MTDFTENLYYIKFIFLQLVTFLNFDLNLNYKLLLFIFIIN